MLSRRAFLRALFVLPVALPAALKAAASTPAATPLLTGSLGIWKGVTLRYRSTSLNAVRLRAIRQIMDVRVFTAWPSMKGALLHSHKEVNQRPHA